NNINKLILIPSSGGVFEVTLNGELIFSKKELDRFPEENEVEDKIRKLMEKMS
ncbi:MAG: SelT/SelW/SelH family protein, partial [Tissierellia bacterium]|nr:SelT/SelW/SelH family protein [Tissierellia bacterium]